MKTKPHAKLGFSPREVIARSACDEAISNPKLDCFASLAMTDFAVFLKKFFKMQKPSKYSKAGFTMVELSIGVILGALIILAVTNLFSGGLKTSTKGSAHLVNLQAASILLAQIEEDLQRTSEINYPTAGSTETSINVKLETIEEKQTGTVSPVSVMYEQATGGGGVKRIRDEGTGPQEHVYCRNLKVNIAFRRVELPEGRTGLWVRLNTANPKGSEEFTLERFFFCPSKIGNNELAGWQH